MGTDQWPFNREVDHTTYDWTPLLQGGPNGMYLVVVSLGWWLLAASKAADEKPAEWAQVEEALADVEWVLGHLLSFLTRAGPSKRAAPDANSPNSKKARHD